MWEKPELLNELVVKEIDECGDEILIHTECGRTFRFYHDQDCCESVGIWDSKGDLKTLEGHKLVDVTWTVCDVPDDVEKQMYESYTWTEITFKTTEDTVVSRWLGESNGYYSESVYFSEVKN